MRTTPTHQQVTEHIQIANEASDDARKLRRSLRRKTKKSEFRNPQIEAMLKRLQVAASPLRSYAGMFQWHDISEHNERKIKAAAKRLTYERNQLRKMLR